jgi:tetratricopeptide (TPR) repeat protein
MSFRRNIGIDPDALEAAVAAKDSGNVLFRQKKFAEARVQYDTGIAKLDEACPATRRLLVSLLLNAALCSISGCDHQKAKDLCQRAIVIEARSTKAHFLLGKCHKALGSTKEAQASFTEALELQPDSKEVRAELERLAEK